MARLLWIDAGPYATVADLRALEPPEVDRIVAARPGRLAFLADELGPLPPCVPLEARYGNGIRLVVGAFTSTGHPYRQRLTILEALVDRTDAELLDRMRALGAADAWATPVLTGTVAYRLSVLTPVDRVSAIRQALPGWAYRIERIALARAQRTVSYRGHPVSIKLGLYDGTVLTAQPEYDDARQAATALGLPTRHVLTEVRAHLEPVTCRRWASAAPG